MIPICKSIVKFGYRGERLIEPSSKRLIGYSFILTPNSRIAFVLALLKRCIKQAPQCWNQALDAQSSNDPCIYISTTNGLLILVMNIDDILLARKSQQRIYQVKADLGEHFRVKYMGELHYFFEVSVKQNSENGNM